VKRPEVVIRQASPKEAPRSWADAHGALAQVLEDVRVHGNWGKGRKRHECIGVLELPVDLTPRLRKETR
jgi:hypothetical protein